MGCPLKVDPGCLLTMSFQLVDRGQCTEGNTSSHLSTEVKQYWAWIVLGWETASELLVLLTKTKAGHCCGRMKVKQMDNKLFQGIQSLEKSGLCSGQLAHDFCKGVPQNTGYFNGPDHVDCGAMKFEVDLGRKVTWCFGLYRTSVLLQIRITYIECSNPSRYSARHVGVYNDQFDQASNAEFQYKVGRD